MEEKTLTDRPILHQEGHSVREIYQDFYALVGETFADRGYKYRKSKHDMYKKIGIFRIELDYQTFSWNAIDENIDVTIHMRICYQHPDGEEGWFFVYDINNQENEVSNVFDLKDVIPTFLAPCGGSVPRVPGITRWQLGKGVALVMALKPTPHGTS